MTEPSNQAERFHRARVEFEEAMALGCTILELRRRKADARARLRQRAQAEVAEHTADLMIQQPAQRDFLAWDTQHMLRD